MQSCPCRPTLGSPQAALLVALAVGLLSPRLAFGVDDTEAPQLVSLQFSPASIKTSASSADVTISFTATDNASGVTYLETGFVDSTGNFRQQGTAKFAPTLAATNSIRITFPRFSPAGAWTLSQVFLADAAGNTLSLDTEALHARRFPTRLEVISDQDTVPPKLTALNFAPARIDTSTRPAEVKVNYTATDNVAGVSYLEMAFSSPSGAAKRSATVKLDPAQSVSNSVTVTFPQLSEPGQWILGPVFLMDAANNTLVLDAAGLSGLGFPTTLDVLSAADTISPRLTNFRFDPATVDISQGAAAVKVEFTATDNLSGVNYFEVGLVSPSGARQNGSRKFSPARELTDSVVVNFPPSSEPGQWTLGSMLLGDAAGNTLILDGAGVSGIGPTILEVKSRTDTVSPMLTSLRLDTAAIDTTQGPAMVKVEFTATDNLSGVKSLEVSLVGPSGAARQTGSRAFSPPSREVTDSVQVSFPRSSEPGVWIVNSVLLTDEAGNTLVLDADGAASKGSGRLQVR